MEDLARLRTVSNDNFAEAERRIEEAHNTGATSLDLGDLKLERLPESLRQLTGLKRLSLGLLKLIGEDGLEWDWRRQAAPLADLSQLESLESLEFLAIGFTQVKDLAPLQNLKNLAYLNIGSTQVRDLAPLQNLKNLESLFISSTQVRDLAPLQNLKNLAFLNMRSTQVRDLTPLQNLRSFKSLLFRSTQVKDLAPIQNLKNISFLEISETQCKELQPILGFTKLKGLLLWGLPRVRFDALHQLLARNPQLDALVCTGAEGVPREVLSSSQLDNCLPRLQSYLAEVEEGAVAETEVKVVLLGNGRVGKTQLCRRLRGEAADFKIESTHGVQLWREPLQLATTDGAKTYWINWWDFGGQDIYHGTHSLFLRTRAVFLLLWHPDYETTEEFENHGIPMRNQPLAYWLDYIRSLAGKDSPVIVVQSQCETFSQEKGLPLQPEGFPFLRSCAFAAANDHGRDSLETHLREAIRYLREKTGDLEIGKARAALRSRLFALREEDSKRPPEKKQHQTLTVEDFQLLCEEARGIHSWQHALDQFHQTGVVFHQPDIFKDLIILDQRWALDAIYTVFHRAKVVPALRDRGVFTRLDLEALVWQGRPPEEQRLFLSMMESCGICFRYREEEGQEPYYLAPDLLPPFERVSKRLHRWKEDGEILTLRLDYRFLHQAILRTLLSQVGADAREAATYWKYGLHLYDRASDAQLLIREERPDPEAEGTTGKGAGAVLLQAQGKDPASLLRKIHWLLHRQRFAEEPEVSLTRGGETVALAALEMQNAGKVRAASGRWVPARPFTFLDQADGERNPLEDEGMHEASERTGIDAASMETGDPRADVFLSYAWGDDTEEGKNRNAAVDRLQQALQDDGFQVVRDRDVLVPGDSIRDFMKRLAKGAHVVCVISEKYLESPNCMYELYTLYQRCGTDRRELAERIVPVILPEVKIGNLRQRAAHMKYWAKEHRELEEIFRDPDLRPSDDSLREVNLVRDFANHIDKILVFVNDMLMPRNLGTNLVHGFEPVRKLLRERLD